MTKMDGEGWKQTEGLIIPSMEGYGGFQKSWDFGPYGVILKRKIKSLFWNFFQTYNPYVVGYDGTILTSPEVWKASGHQQNFFDWSVDCQKCKKRQRLDELEKNVEIDNQFSFTCSKCFFFQKTTPYRFSLFLKTNFGSRECYLRPETCQGIFTNIYSIKRAIRRQLPFGVAQIGKSFRNETTLHHGIFRTREFEQMELEFFCSPEEADKWWNYWTQKSWSFLKKLLVINPEKVKKESLAKEELPHYSKRTIDFYYQYSFGWGELCSNSDRGVYDLQCHFPSKTPLAQVIEISFGVERLFLAILEDSYQDSVMRFSPLLSPYFAAVLAVFPKFHQRAYELFLFLLAKVFPFEISYEKSSSVGKGYYYQDSLGTFFCLTVDQQTLIDQSVTIRYRDSREQERISQDNLENFLNTKYRNYFKAFFS